MGLAEDQSRFFGKLGSMMEAGIPLLRAFEVAVQAVESEDLRAALERIMGRAYGGSSLMDSIRPEEQHFSTEVLTLLTEGEENGDLEKKALAISRGLSEGVFLAGPTLDAEAAAREALLNRFLAQAAELGATELHLEPGAQGFRIRCRVEEGLRQVETFRPEEAVTLLRAVRERAGIGPEEADGAFVAGDRTAVIRCCVFEGGEGFLLELRPREGDAVSLEGEGMEPVPVETVRGWLSEGHGLVAVTGLRFGGRARVVAGLFAEIDASRGKVAAIDAPVEVSLPGAVRIRSAGSRAGAISTAMAQRADVVLVFGDLDEEAAETAVEAALSGHLVVCVLRSLGAPEGLVRLTGLRVRGDLLAAALRGVIHVRRVPGAEGGEVSVFEVLDATPGLRTYLVEDPGAARVREIAEAEGLVPLAEVARGLVTQGLVTSEEMRRVLGVG